MPVRHSVVGVVSAVLLSGGLALATPVVASGQPRVDVNGISSPATLQVPSGSVVHVAVSDGPANATDWIGLYPAGAADTAYVSWYYLSGTITPPSTGLTSVTLSVLLPTSPGDYECRLFAANGYTRLATGPTVHVLASAATIRVNGVFPPAAVSVSPATALTVVVEGAPANSTDWIGFFPVGAGDTSWYVEWQYLNGSTTAPPTGQSQATLAFFAPADSGTYELRLFAGGGYSRLTVSPAIAVAVPQAGVLVNGTAPPTGVTVAAGSLALLTVTGAPGNATDWVGLYPAGAPDTAYVDWRYLSGLATPPSVGLTDASVSWLMPATPGAYEFRLFAHNAYQRVATSSPVTVPSSAAVVSVNGVLPPQATTAGAGTVLTITIANGPSNSTDWVGLFVAGAPESTPLTWQYLNGSTTAPSSGIPNASLRLLAPVTGGAYEVRFLTGNTYHRLATSGPLTITPPSARIAVNGIVPPASVSATPGSSLNVDVLGAPGNRADWMGVYRLADPDTAPLTWVYMNGSTALPVDPLTSAIWSVPAPSDAGSYEVRLFVDNGYARLGASPAIVIGVPAVSVSLTSPFPGTVFPASTPIPLAASASATSGTVARVEFEVDGTVVASANEPPYTSTWTSALPGAHVVAAVAVDNLNGRTSSSPVSVAIATTGPGTLGPPLIAPPGGRFAHTQTVTMQAAAGATIRYTTDGSEPDETSPLYVGPFTIEQDATVMARAFQAGWFPSPPASATLVIDRTPPTMLVFVIPAANAAGWNNAPVTVSFRCADASGMRSCPVPISVTSDGTTNVQGVAVDAVGNQGSTSTTVRLDRTAPTLVLPGDTSRQTSDATVTLTGTAADEASGMARVTCNGLSATLGTAGAFTCEVPLQPGLNPVVVHAVDVAGNGRSAGLRVTRVVPVDAIRVSPVKATIGVGEARDVRSLDQAGQSVSNAEWTVDNSAVLALTTTDGRVSVAGLSPGIATVTATLGSLTGSATITVVTGTLPVGTVRWTSAPGAPGALAGSGPLLANRVDASVPDLYVLESTPAGSQLLRGVFADGTPGSVWTVSPDSSSFAAMSLADRNGGVILDSWSWSNGSQRALVRIPGTADGLPWRHEPAGDAVLVGQSPDGTVYLLENLGSGESPQVVGLDGETGGVRFRYQPPGTNFRATYNIDCHEGYHSIRESGPALNNGVVGYDGALYTVARTSTWVYDYYSQPGCHADQAIPSARVATVSVVRVSSEGSGAVWDLQTAVNEQADPLQGGTLVPDPRGGVHAQWGIGADWGNQQHVRVGPDVSDAAQSGPLLFDRIGDGVGFDGAGTAYDLDTGAVKFTPGEGVWMVTALAGGGVAVTDGVTLSELDETGALVRETPMPVTAMTPPGEMMMSVAIGNDLNYGGGGLWTMVSDQGVLLRKGTDLIHHALEFPDLNSAAQPGEPAYPYGTQEEAAIAALGRFHKTSQEEYVEYGGQVCEATQPGRLPRFGYGPANRGLPCELFAPCSVDPDRFPCSVPGDRRISTKSIGEYHTHPRSEAVSGYDQTHSQHHFNLDPPGLVGFVSTHCGWIRRYGYLASGAWYDDRLYYPAGHLVMLFQPLTPCSASEPSAWNNIFEADGAAFGSGK